MKKFLCLAVYTLTCVSMMFAGAHPSTYLSKSEIVAIRSKLSAGAQPWKGAYDKAMQDAEAALEGGPYSVTFQGKVSQGDKHIYNTERPYWGWSRKGYSQDRRDGHENPDADRGDYEAAVKVSSKARDLGIAYVFSGKELYAQRAATLLRVWCLDPETRMRPEGPFGDNEVIEPWITVPPPHLRSGLDRRFSGVE